MPSDLGFDDNGFVLPPLEVREHVVESKTRRPGTLFAAPAANMREEREECRRTLQERCEKAAMLVRGNSPAVVWCHLNSEGDVLEKIIPDGRQIAGSTPDEEKEELFDAFSTGSLRVLIIKDKIGAWGLNWQHCSHVVRFVSHSYESYYQAIRRCWRFGQKNKVAVDLIETEGQRRIKENLLRKERDADRMFTELVRNMQSELHVDRQVFGKEMEIPTWL